MCGEGCGGGLSETIRRKGLRVQMMVADLVVL